MGNSVTRYFNTCNAADRDIAFPEAHATYYEGLKVAIAVMAKAFNVRPENEEMSAEIS
jgi:hypothetical protein